MLPLKGHLMTQHRLLKNWFVTKTRSGAVIVTNRSSSYTIVLTITHDIISCMFSDISYYLQAIPSSSRPVTSMTNGRVGQRPFTRSTLSDGSSCAR
jgi:hypothetical protein